MENSNFSFFISPLALGLRDLNQTTMDFDSQLDDFTDQAALNGSFGEECLREYQNMTYYNVSCDMPTEFSVPLYGEYTTLLCYISTFVYACLKYISIKASGGAIRAFRYNFLILTHQVLLHLSSYS